MKNFKIMYISVRNDAYSECIIEINVNVLFELKYMCFPWKAVMSCLQRTPFECRIVPHQCSSALNLRYFTKILWAERKDPLITVAVFLALMIKFYIHYSSRISVLVLSLLFNEDFACENGSDLLLQMFVTDKTSHVY